MMFVSYSRLDAAVTRQFIDSLAIAGVECWLDESNIPVGQAFVERLGKALGEADCFLLVDTSASRLSYWVSRELQTAFRYRREGRFHSVLRLYSPDCEPAGADNWDASMPLNPHASRDIAEFLAGRREAQRAHADTNDEFGSVLLLNDSGLGQPSYWTGRQDELLALDRWWLGSHCGAWLCGFGGSGKSGLLQTWVAALSYFGYAENIRASALYLRGSQIQVTETERMLSIWESESNTVERLLLLDGEDEALSTPEVEEVMARAIHLGARLLVTSRRSAPQHLARYFEEIALAINPATL